MIGRKKSPETEIGILNVRLHQIGIRGRIRTYIAEGHNFVIRVKGYILGESESTRGLPTKHGHGRLLLSSQLINPRNIHLKYDIFLMQIHNSQLQG